jgi:uncharacterized protein (TIGR02231 family)
MTPLPPSFAMTALLGLSLTSAAAELPSRIARVTVYPGTAVVERTARVPAGAREVVLNCLGPQFDMASLRVEADAPIRLGPVTATTRPRSESPACSTSPLDGRITALEDRIAALTAEHASHELVLGLLKGTTATVVANTPLAATLPLVQRAGLDALQQQHRLQREREKLERELLPLKAERERQQPGGGEVRQLRVQLQAGAEGELRLQYQTAGPTWAPAYRATLDTTAAVVEMERQAQVSQNTGEDWAGVALRLSTGSPQSATSGPAPRRWEISPRPPMPVAPVAMAMAAPAPAPALMARKGSAMESAESMDFAVQVRQGEFATEFEVPGQVDVAQGGQRVAFSLGTQRWPARVKVQTVPQADPSAWLIAEVARPDGVWPDGSLQLQRGTQVVGRTTWRLGERETLALSFGRDEQVRVQNLPVTQQTASAGFIGTRTERRVGRLYEVENRRRTAVTLEVLESTPVSTDEKITVTRQFTPAPQPGDWQDQPGVVAWTQTLAPGQKARFGAEYLIGHAKDLPVIERR